MTKAEQQRTTKSLEAAEAMADVLIDSAQAITGVWFSTSAMSEDADDEEGAE